LCGRRRRAAGIRGQGADHAGDFFAQERHSAFQLLFVADEPDALAGDGLRELDDEGDGFGADGLDEALDFLLDFGVVFGVFCC
jgi:hypothetical protein